GVWRCGVAERDEDETTGERNRGAHQRIVGAIEPVDRLHVARGEQCAVERVRPGVKRTLDRGEEVPRRLAANARAARAAKVVHPADGVAAVAHDDQTLAGDLGEKVVTGLLDLFLATDADPRARKDALLLRCEYLGRRVPARVERVGAGGDARP